MKQIRSTEMRISYRLKEQHCNVRTHNVETKKVTIMATTVNTAMKIAQFLTLHDEGVKVA
jgi:hypothetical protein